MNFLDLCKIKEIVLYLHKDIYLKDNILLVCKRPGHTENAEHVNNISIRDAAGDAILLFIDKGKLVRCFMNVEYMLSHYKINFINPEIYLITEVNRTIDNIKSLTSMAEIHWIKDKLEIESVEFTDEESYNEILKDIDPNKN